MTRWEDRCARFCPNCRIRYRRARVHLFPAILAAVALVGFLAILAGEPVAGVG